MQCPTTPQFETRQNIPFPQDSAHNTTTLRRRTFSTPHPVYRNASLRIARPELATPNYRLSQVSVGRDRPSSTLFGSASPIAQKDALSPDDDVFESQTKSSAAISQFHDAARRLALSPLSSNLQDQTIGEGSVFETPTRHRSNPLAISNLGCGKSPRHTKYTNRQIPYECDITGARKEILYKPRYHPGKSPAPGSAPRPFVYGSPNASSPKRINKARQPHLSPPRNFSRPNFSHPTTLSTYGRKNFSRPLRPAGQRSYIQSESKGRVRSNTAASPRTQPVGTEEKDSRGTEGGKASQNTVACQEDTMLRTGRHDKNISAAVPVQTDVQSLNGTSIHDPIRESFDSAVTECLGDKRLQLGGWEIWFQRILISLFIFGANVALGLAYLGSFKHPYMLAILVFMKCKDILSTMADILGILHAMIRQWIWPAGTPDPKWILSLVCAYAETEEQILKTVYSLARGKTQPHNQAICIILDGKPRNILEKMSSIEKTVQRPYTTWRGNRGEIVVNAGYLEGVPLILVAKAKNAGKKDSLILGHDLFNFPRKDMPYSTQMLRREVWQSVLPAVIKPVKSVLEKFDFIFCTDADSTIHGMALRRLADALSKEDNAIAGCGVLFAEFGPWATEYSPWHLFQQFQYTFGQYVRRQAESTWGRVTCLPGCISMIVVRPEMGRAISEYARPVTEHNLFRHQVQYLGTDRRLTWCMMTQGKHLRTVFVPDALSETVVPNGISHYLSQRRRWASNAYFNDFFYLLGPRQRLVTRLFAAIDIVRLTLVYYRVFNTGYFLHGLITNFYVVKIIPTLIVTKTPATWYLILVLAKEPFLRKRLHKILLGMCINQVISPILSVIVFTNVLFHIGSQAWGRTGISTQGTAKTSISETVVHPSHELSPSQKWTPRRLARSVRLAIRGITPKRSSRKQSEGKAVLSPALQPHNLEPAAMLHNVTSPPAQDAPLRSHPLSTSHTVSNTPTASTTCSDLQQSTWTANQPGSASVICTPSHKLQRQSFSTPMTLSRRTPYRRSRAQSKLQPINDTPVRRTDDSAHAMTYEDKDEGQSILTE